MKNSKPNWPAIIGLGFPRKVYAIKKDGTKVKVQDDYDPGPAKGAKWDDPCIPYNRGKEITRWI